MMALLAVARPATGDDPPRRGADLERASRVVLDAHGGKVRAGLWVGGRSGAPAFAVDPDATLPFVAEADVAVRLPGSTPADTYLRIDLVLDAARRAGADAVHPGYGFLSENADFAQAVLDAGLTWIGPSPDAILALGDKVQARHIAMKAGAPLVPGTKDPVGGADEVLAFAEEHGFLDLSRSNARPTVGEVVRVIPNHVCVVVNMVDQLIAVRGERIVEVLPVPARGKLV